MKRLESWKVCDDLILSCMYWRTWSLQTSQGDEFKKCSVHFTEIPCPALCYSRHVKCLLAIGHSILAEPFGRPLCKLRLAQGYSKWWSISRPSLQVWSDRCCMLSRVLWGTWGDGRLQGDCLESWDPVDTDVGRFLGSRNFVINLSLLTLVPQAISSNTILKTG